MSKLKVKVTGQSSQSQEGKIHTSKMTMHTQWGETNARSAKKQTWIWNCKWVTATGILCLSGSLCWSGRWDIEWRIYSWKKDTKSCSTCHRNCSNCSTVLLLSISFSSRRAFGTSGSKYLCALRTPSRPMLNKGWQGFYTQPHIHTLLLYQMSLSHKTLKEYIWSPYYIGRP